MKRDLRKISLFLALLLFLTTAVGFASSSIDKLGSIKNKHFNDLEGNKKTLTEYKGKVVLVNFWASWCSPCRMEVPELNRVYDRYSTKGFEMVGLSVDTSYGLTKIKDISQRWRIKYDVGRADMDMINEMGIFAVPISMLYGKDGKLIKKYTGPPHPEALEAEIKKALGI